MEEDLPNMAGHGGIKYKVNAREQMMRKWFRYLLIIACLGAISWATISFIRFNSGYEESRLRMNKEQKVLFRRQQFLSRIVDFLSQEEHDFMFWSKDYLKKNIKGAKVVKEIDDGFYLLSDKKSLALLGVPDYTDPDFYSIIVLCDARVKDYYADNGKSSELYYYSTVYSDGMSHFKSTLPPVPGCNYHGVIDGGSDKIKYPEIARKRFKIYYPELYERLEKNNFQIEISK
jgi:hypothetical protein